MNCAVLPPLIVLFLIVPSPTFSSRKALITSPVYSLSAVLLPASLFGKTGVAYAAILFILLPIGTYNILSVYNGSVLTVHTLS